MVYLLCYANIPSLGIYLIEEKECIPGDITCVHQKARGEVSGNHIY